MDYWSERFLRGGVMLRKSVLVVLGLISAFAGIVALLGYAIPAVEDLLPVSAGVVVYRGDSLLMRLLGAVLTCGLAAGHSTWRFVSCGAF
jgi:hypothetical protein